MKRVMPALVFFSFIIWVIIQANLGNNNIFFELIDSIPFGDKLGHFVLYGSLSIFTVIALNYHCVLIKERHIPSGAILVLVLAILEEATQLFLANRTFDMIDISADIVGIFVFTYLFLMGKKRYSKLN